MVVAAEEVVEQQENIKRYDSQPSKVQFTFKFLKVPIQKH